MHPLLVSADTTGATPIHCVASADNSSFLAGLPAHHQATLSALGFEAKPGSVAVLTQAVGGIESVVFGAGGQDPLVAGKLPVAIPPGTYRFQGPVGDATLAALSFINAQYRFSRYKSAPDRPRRLCLPEGVSGEALTRAIEATWLARDLINTPANDLGPAELEAAIRDLGARHGAQVTAIIGDELIAKNFPMIHAVGMGSPRAPRLVDLIWGDPTHPKVTLVGKGVCFDTGGLDIKPDAAMLLMKKDMGGAAAAIGLAHLIMAAQLPVRLRLLVPAVENSVSGTAFRPGDIWRTRKGLSVEIGNTDAEGRLVLADALALADEEAPAMLVDFATLTGAARVALGPDLPPVYGHDDALVAEVVAAGARVADPVWRLPLWPAYAAGLESKIADLNNVAAGGTAGSITAALFLDRFVDKARAGWLHFDIYGWTPSEKPGRPHGGEFQAGRAVFDVIAARFGG
jgi:leucyl aminopeptidase